MALYATKRPTCGYIWLHFLSALQAYSCEDFATIFCSFWVALFCLIAYANDDFNLFWPSVLLVLYVAYIRWSAATWRTKADVAAFGDFYSTKERLGCPGGITRHALDTSWEPGMITDKHGGRPFRHVFVERNTNRQVFLRGINVGGGCKLPPGVTTDQQLPASDVGPEAPAEVHPIGRAADLSPGGATFQGASSFPPSSFTGRPFPLHEADEHFRRLLAYGFTFFRLLVTWEAVEPEKPGVYDEEYLDYVQKLVTRAGEYGIAVFIDFHQDVWSRYTGGSGAPRWTLECVGFQPALFKETLAAVRHCDYRWHPPIDGRDGAKGRISRTSNAKSLASSPDKMLNTSTLSSEGGRGRGESTADPEHERDEFPKMWWANNHMHLACATMFSLFFGGDDFAPRFRINRKCSKLYGDDEEEEEEQERSFSGEHHQVHSASSSGHDQPLRLAPFSAHQGRDGAGAGGNLGSWDAVEDLGLNDDSQQEDVVSPAAAQDGGGLNPTHIITEIIPETVVSPAGAASDFSYLDSKSKETKDGLSKIVTPAASMMSDSFVVPVAAHNKVEATGSRSNAGSRTASRRGSPVESAQQQASVSFGITKSASPAASSGSKNQVHDFDAEDTSREEQQISVELPGIETEGAHSAVLPAKQKHHISSQDLPYFLLNADASSPNLFPNRLDNANFISIQQFLQDHYLGAVRQVATKLKNCDNVLGFDTLNEPDCGFIGNANLDEWKALGGGKDPTGYLLTPVEAMGLGSGCSLPVDYFEGIWKYKKTVEFANPFKKSCWKPGYECIWKQHGVYDVDALDGRPLLRQPDYFSKNPRTGLPVKAHDDYLVPFWKKVSATIREAMDSPDAYTFCSPYAGAMDMTSHCDALPSTFGSSASSAVEGASGQGQLSGYGSYRDVENMGNYGSSDPIKEHRSALGDRCIYSPHYYEGLQLLYHNYRANFVTNFENIVRGKGCPIYFGTDRMCAKKIGRDIRHFADHGRDLGPTVIGETGISMDIEGEASRTKCMQRIMRGLEHSGVGGYTIWHYCPEASFKGKDGWNREHLSVFGQGDGEILPNSSPYAGGRALPAVIRPSPFLVAGRIRYFRFELERKRLFELEYEEVATCESNQTILFVPFYHYSPETVRTLCSDGQFVERDLISQKFIYVHDSGIPPNAEGKKIHRIQIWHEEIGSGSASSRSSSLPASSPGLSERPLMRQR
eukprot:g4912.t1